MSERESGPPEIDVRYTADLARLSLTDEEVACFQQQFGDILKLVGASHYQVALERFIWLARLCQGGVVWQPGT